MQSPKPRYTTSLFALILVAANAARADEISFSWQSTITPSSVAADQAAGGSLGLIGMGGTTKYTPLPSWDDEHAIGATYRPLASEQAFSTFTNTPFTLTLKLTDSPSGLSGVLTFHGLLNGTAFVGSGTLAGSYPSVSFPDGVRSVVIGQDTYHIQLPAGWLIGIGPDPYPGIFAKIDVSTASTTPEPSSLLLAAMALPVLGFTFRRKNAVIRP